MLISVEGVSKQYPALRVQALRDVSLSVREGDFLALMGPSGSGKSTLLQLMGALDTPDSGQIFFKGQPYGNPVQMADFRAQSVGFVFQAFHLLPTLTALENVQVPMLSVPQPARQRRETARALLAEVGLADRGHHPPAQMSGGERQRVALARALANRPKLLLADEPTGNLDSHNAGQLMDLLVALRQRMGLSILLVTHDADVAARADRILRMRDGRLLDRVEGTAP